jgi:hypothetical protein
VSPAINVHARSGAAVRHLTDTHHPGECPEDRHVVADGSSDATDRPTDNCIATDVDRREPGLVELNVGSVAVDLANLAPFLPVLVPAILFATVRVVKHVLRYRERVLDYYLECYIVANSGPQGLRDLAELELALAELERARRRKRRRVKFPRMKGKERGSPPKSLPTNPFDDRPAA